MNRCSGYLAYVVVAVFSANSALAQQPSPAADLGYAVEGRPGFVVHYDSESSMNWEPFDIAGMPSGMQKKILSQSPSMGAQTLITYIPEGWSHDSGFHNVDEEIFVLEGDLSIVDVQGEQSLSRYSYTFIPAGLVHGPVRSRQGAVLLHWFKGPPDFVESEVNKPGTRQHAQVRDWNHFDSPWYVDEPFPEYRVGGNIPGAIHKQIRRDPDTGEMTWLSFSASIPATSHSAGIFGGGYEVHPSFEEYFLLEKTADTYIGECLESGLIQARTNNRSYWWRPAGIAHGGPTSHSDETPGYSISLVHTGTQLWAEYFTDCSKQTQIEFTGNGFRTYDVKSKK